MDKSRTLDDENLKPYVHTLPRGRQMIHRQYGLWMCHFWRGVCDPAGNFYTKRPRYFEFFSLSHVFEGGGRLWMPPDREQNVEAGQCIIMPPGEVNRYGGAEKSFYEDSICFIGPIADRMVDCGIIQAGVFQFGTSRRLLPIMDIASDPSRDSQIEANLMLQRLMFELYRENRAGDGKRSSPIEQLLVELKNNIHHWWTVSEMAKFCQLGEDQLRRLFLRDIGMHPKQYVDRLRMRTAATMLTEGRRTVKQIAQELGYTDQFHFSRRFKTITGLPPQAYRSQYGKFEES